MKQATLFQFKRYKTTNLHFRKSDQPQDPSKKRKVDDDVVEVVKTETKDIKQEKDTKQPKPLETIPETKKSTAKIVSQDVKSTPQESTKPDSNNSKVTSTIKKPKEDSQEKREPKKRKKKQEKKEDKMDLVEKTPVSAKSSDPAPFEDLKSPVTPKKGGTWTYGQTRAAPRNPGSKPVPIAKPDCLKGVAFVVTGVMESLERDEIEDLIKRYGGFVRASLSKKTDYVVVGDQPGESKMKKAIELETKQLSEDDFLALLKKHEIKEDSQPDSQNSKPDSGKTKSVPVTPWNPVHTSTLWTTQFAPSKLSEIIGNATAISNIVKWLDDWTPNMKEKKAIMISGQPGIGKTTSAKLIAQSCGYANIIELNASDQRNKSSLATLKEMINNTALDNKKSILIFDECDGMSGGDRGGITELIGMIKKTKIPIICICNDRWKPSLKSLMNHCLDFKFTHPVKTTMVKRIVEVCKKQGLNLGETVVSALVESLNYDIRSILNHLQMLSYSNKTLTYDEAKTIKMDAIQENVFQVTNFFFIHRPKSFHQLQQYYYDDSSLIPLMIQQNYLHHYNRAWNRMNAIAKAAESISFSDTIHVFRDWSLTHEHSFFSCIYPTYYCFGNFEKLLPNDPHYPMFPSVLGKGSTTRKNNNILNILQKDTILQTSGGLHDILFDYAPLWQRKLLKPLKEGQLQDVIAIMRQYRLTKDDLLNICDLLCMGKKLENPYLDIPTKNKSAFTRLYNKEFKAARIDSKRESDDDEDAMDLE